MPTVNINALAKELEKLLISKKRIPRKSKPKPRPKPKPKPKTTVRTRKVKKRKTNQKGYGPSHSSRVLPYTQPEPEPVLAEAFTFDPLRPSVLPPLEQDTLEYILKLTIAKRFNPNATEQSALNIDLNNYIFKLYYIDQTDAKFSHEISGYTLSTSRPFDHRLIMLYYIKFRNIASRRYTDGWKSSSINNYFGLQHNDYTILTDPLIYN